MGYVNSLEGNHITFVLTNDALTTMMPGERDQAIGLQRLESPKDSVSRLETFESLEKVICAWISTNSSRKDTMGVDDYDCVLGKNLGQQKGNPERFSVNNFFPTQKRGFIDCCIQVLPFRVISSMGGQWSIFDSVGPPRGQNPPAVSDDRFEALGLPPAQFEPPWWRSVALSCHFSRVKNPP